jgi:hypothetical protein
MHLESVVRTFRIGQQQRDFPYYYRWMICTCEIYEWHLVPEQYCWGHSTPTETPILLPLLMDGHPAQITFSMSTIKVDEEHHQGRKVSLSPLQYLLTCKNKNSENGAASLAPLFVRV